MPKRAKGGDINQLAASILAQTTDETYSQPTTGKHPAAVALGRLGGLKGGKARAETLSARQRKAIAKKAAVARWTKHKK